MARESRVIVSVSGIRAIVGQGLTPELAASFAAALGTYTGGGRIVLSRDGRPSGVMLRDAVLGGLANVGCQVEDLGVAPTPTCGLAIRKLKSAGGIQITASHNPAEWNGLKLFGPDGAVLSAAEGKKVQSLFVASGGASVPRCTSAPRSAPECLDWHLQRVLELVDVATIRARHFTVFLDANGGAGGPLGMKLLDALSCRTIGHGCDADGRFLHVPEPIETNLVSICPLVKEHNADIGFVLDPDADRLALIDATGRYIGEELTLALAVFFRLQQASGGRQPPVRTSVVINMSSSRVIEDISTRFNAACHRAAVGEANVVELMRQVGALIGGEGNGGVIDPRVGWVRDPFIGMGLVLNLLAQSGKKLSELAAELPVYCIVKDKCPLEPDRLPALFTELERRWPEAKPNRLDGLRLDWPDRWLHVRPSNTEPIVRVIVEAPTREEAEKLTEAARGVALEGT